MTSLNYVSTPGTCFGISLIQRYFVLFGLLVLSGCVGVSLPRPIQPLALPPERLSAPANDAVRLAALDPDTTVNIDRSLPQWVDYALANNPRIRSAITDYEAAVQGIEQANSLPDPQLSVRYFFEPVETRVGPQNYAVGISQPLPWLGKLRMQAAVASEQASAAALRVSTLQNSVIAEVARAWYELYYFSRALSITRENRDLVRQLERVARARYQTDATSHADIIKAQIELGKIENELASLIDRERPLVARLNAALNRPYQAPIILPDTAPIMTIVESDQSLVARVAANNPELQALAFDVAAATAVKERAEQAFFPDFSIGLEYIATGSARASDVPGSGSDPIAAAFSMTLPMRRDSYAAAVRAAEARIAGQRARRDHYLNQLEADTVSALFRLRDAQRQLDLYQGTLLPKAQESLVVTQQGYRAGDATFSDLIEAQRTLLVFELAEARAITDHHQARISLEELVGGPLTDLSNDTELSHD